MTIFIVVVHVIVCLVLILVILLQAGRGQGLSGASMGGSSTQSIFGTRAADFLTKATTVSALLFLVTCITLDLIHSRRSRSLVEAARAPADSGITAEAFRRALEKLKGSVGGPADETQPALPQLGEEEAAEAVAEQAAPAAPPATAGEGEPSEVPPASDAGKP